MLKWTLNRKEQKSGKTRPKIKVVDFPTMLLASHTNGLALCPVISAWDGQPLDDKEMPMQNGLKKAPGAQTTFNPLKPTSTRLGETMKGR